LKSTHNRKIAAALQTRIARNDVHRGSNDKVHLAEPGDRARLLLIFRVRIAMRSVNCGYAQATPGAGQVSTPESSIERPGHTGVWAHTNIEIFTPSGGPAAAQAPGGGPGAIASPAPDANAGNGGRSQ